MTNDKWYLLSHPVIASAVREAIPKLA